MHCLYDIINIFLSARSYHTIKYHTWREGIVDAYLPTLPRSTSRSTYLSTYLTRTPHSISNIDHGDRRLRKRRVYCGLDRNRSQYNSTDPPYPRPKVRLQASKGVVFESACDRGNIICRICHDVYNNNIY